MKEKEVIRELESLGTEQNRKVYRRHGVGENLYGVSYANLNALKKKIRVDHELAKKLWSTDNHDARVLATLIADPQKASSPDIEAWGRDLTNYVLTDAFANFVGNTRFAQKLAGKWTRSKKEWTGRAGWLILGYLAMKDRELHDDYFESYLDVIEKEIHRSKNRVKDAMNSALIAIGIRNQSLEKKAIACARKIGRVEVDHGETGCKTPDAVQYIMKASSRRKKAPAVKARS